MFEVGGSESFDDFARAHLGVFHLADEPCVCIGRFFVEFEGLVDGSKGLGSFGSLDKATDFDLAGGDHLDVDPGVCQGAEHLFGHSGLFGHSEADDGDFGDRIVAGDLGGPDQGERFLDGFLGFAEFVARDGKRHIGSGLHTDVLDDHIDGNFSVGEPFEDLVAHAWCVLDIFDR